MPASKGKTQLSQKMKTMKGRRAEPKEESRVLRSPRPTGKKVSPEAGKLKATPEALPMSVEGKPRNLRMEDKISRDTRDFHFPLNEQNAKGGTVHRVSVAHRVVIFGPPRGHPQISVELELQRDLKACLDHYAKVFREVRAVFSKGTYLCPRNPEPSTYSGRIAFLKEGDPGKVTLPMETFDRYSSWCDFDHESAMSFVTWNGRESFVAVSRAIKDDKLFVPSLLLALKGSNYLPDCELGELLSVTALEFRGTVTCNIVKPLQLNWQCYDSNGEATDWQAIQFGPSDTGPSMPNQEEDEELDVVSDDSGRYRRGIYPTVVRNFSLTNVKSTLSLTATDNMEEEVGNLKTR